MSSFVSAHLTWKLSEAVSNGHSEDQFLAILLSVMIRAELPIRDSILDTRLYLFFYSHRHCDMDWCDLQCAFREAN
jgi:hypothetical protein